MLQRTSTNYYFCAFAKNNEGIGYGNIVGFTTSDNSMFNIVVSRSPEEGGQVEGGGIYTEGDVCELDATKNDHYEFMYWSENGQIVSESVHYSFTVDCNRSLVANFSKERHLVSAISNPNDGGTIEGSGEYEYEETCSLEAIPNEGFVFVNWTDNNGNQVSLDNPYHFIVTGSRLLYANFNKVLPQVPEGGIDALFSIGGGEKVFFSQGNLQYRAYDGKWQFAANQWASIGAPNANISPNYNEWIDLFGWGTGSNPTYTGTNADFVDWGENSISNGGGVSVFWRTMTKQEWDFLLNTRNASTINGFANARYTKAVVYGKKGIILFPDEFEHPNGISIQISAINNPDASFDINTFLYSQWQLLESKGCVFLPITGIRYSTSVSDIDIRGCYWSSTSNNSNTANGLRFDESSLKSDFSFGRSAGIAVRLVHPVR